MWPRDTLTQIGGPRVGHLCYRATFSLVTNKASVFFHSSTHAQVLHTRKIREPHANIRSLLQTIKLSVPSFEN